MKKNYTLIMIQENEQKNKCLFIAYSWEKKQGTYLGLPVVANLPQATTNKNGGLVFDYFEAVKLLEQDGDTAAEIQQKMVKAFNSFTFLTVGKTSYHTSTDSKRLIKRLEKVEASQVVIDWATFHDTSGRV